MLILLLEVAVGLGVFLPLGEAVLHAFVSSLRNPTLEHGKFVELRLIELGEDEMLVVRILL